MNINPIPPVSVAHELPHRLRLRCRVLKNPALDPEFFEATLSSISGVEEARINSLAGSVTVVYDGFAVTEGVSSAAFHPQPMMFLTVTEPRRQYNQS